MISAILDIEAGNVMDEHIDLPTDGPMKKILKVGIATTQELEMREFLIENGDYIPGPDEPEVWFPSLAVFARTMAGQNLAILNYIKEEQPESLVRLAETTGRNISTVTEILRNLEKFGLVKFHLEAPRRIRPEVTYDSIQVTMHLGAKPYVRPKHGPKTRKF